MHTLQALHDCGQSYWLDLLTRRMIKSGDLKRRVAHEGLRGITSNPSIFQKSISGGSEYDTQISRLVTQGVSTASIYETLVTTDIQEACDILLPVYESSDGADGFVSLEVSPHLAYSAEGTVAEARRLWAQVNRPNLLVKVPGTKEAAPAIKRLLYEGININITLLFSVASYERVALAYQSALEQRVSEGLGIRNVASVASFFVSRIDVLVDQLLGERWHAARSLDERVMLAKLFGQAAIANAKLAYHSFLRMVKAKRWQRLKAKGARTQRLLWASTSTKDPLYRDVRYVEELIGRDTIDTMPEETAKAFLRHGKVVADRIVKGVDEAKNTMSELARLGIDFDQVAVRLEQEGVKKFIDPFDKLLASLAQKRRDVTKRGRNRQQLPEPDQGRVKEALQALDTRRFLARLNKKDGTIWRSDAEAAKSIENRLGWLDSPAEFLERVEEIRSFANEAQRDGIKHVALLGMGGSSLCPEVCAQTFGSARGWPDLVVLDNTAPEAVLQLASSIDAARTLFIVPSKSGTTIETISFYRYFWDQVSGKTRTPGKLFVAITDPGSWLATEAAAKKFRRCFLNPPDIGGRYSALSYFGLVPMALLGLDVRSLLERSNRLQAPDSPDLPSAVSRAVGLGAWLGLHAKNGRDKLTFITSQNIASFGNWVEQLIAESTGKNGVGILPVVGEPVGPPRVYGDDRLFVYMTHAASEKKAIAKRVAALEKSGFPVARIGLPDRMGLGEEFLRWELATATAGAILAINPFDEPNVAESKRNTSELLSAWLKNQKFAEGRPAARANGLAVYGPSSKKRTTPEKLIADFVAGLKPGDYFALLGYFRRTAPRERILEQMRLAVRDRFQVATTLGYGPRYLHSTGQLHKGGPNTGVYLLITTDVDEEAAIPGQPYGFGVLQRAQALGDLQALRAKDRRVIRVHVAGELKAGLRRVLRALG